MCVCMCVHVCVCVCEREREREREREGVRGGEERGRWEKLLSGVFDFQTFLKFQSFTGKYS